MRVLSFCIVVSRSPSQPYQVPFTSPYPFCHPAAQRVAKIAAFDQRHCILCPRVVHQPVLTVVMVPVGALIIRTDTPFRDEVGFLRQPAVTVIPVKIVRVTGDTVIRPHAEGAVRVQLRVGQAVTCRVCGIRDINAQVTYNNKSN